MIDGLAPAPAQCRALRVTVPKTGRACGVNAGIERLARAVEFLQPVKRDAALAELETCTEFPKGLVRALRADLWRACADTLIAPYLRATNGSFDAELGDALLALALSARWGRASSALQPFASDGSESDVARYHAERLLPWKQRELAKFQKLEQASALVGASGYARVILLLAAERAYRELGIAARRAPIPDRVKRDYEPRVRYYAALDAAFTDVQARGEELGEQTSRAISEQGLHRAVDADRRYHPLSEEAVYGNRDDGYWGLLLLEPPAPLLPSSASERIALRIPSAYSEVLFDESAPSNQRLLRAFIESALSPRQRYALSTRELAADEAEMLAYFQATLAQRTRVSRHWDEAIALLQPLAQRTPAAELLLATARAARSGSRGLQSSKTEASFVLDVTPLEQFARGAYSARLRAFALNNAARLLASSRSLTAVGAAHALISQACTLAPAADRACIRPFDSQRFIKEPDAPCDLPTLP
jgi:hypothetical protein